MASFWPAVARLFELEGGYANVVGDPGGPTKYGITKMTYPDLDIAGLTEAEAANIYKRDYWDMYNYGLIRSQRVATKIFTIAVNLPVRNAHKLLQQAANDIGGHHLVVDGIIGPLTIDAVNNTSKSRLVRELRYQQIRYYLRRIEQVPVLAKFRNGWISRACS